MSSPEATGVRQRTGNALEEEKNPASLSTKSDKKVPRNKPQVKPPFSNSSFGRFMSYLVLCLVAIGAFYAWRFTVWAADAGGYWNLITGKHDASAGPGRVAMSAAAKAAGKAKAKNQAGSGTVAGKGTDVESQIIQLANSLGVKPADLSSAIRPLIDPTAPNPVEAAKVEAQKEVLRAKGAAKGGAAADGGSAEEPGILAQMGEALLD